MARVMRKQVPASWVFPADVIIVGWRGDLLHPEPAGTPETFASEVLDVRKDGHGMLVFTMMEGETHPLANSVKVTKCETDPLPGVEWLDALP